jgi:hypothetical protein
MDIIQKLKGNSIPLGIFICALFLGIIITLLALPILGISLTPKEIGTQEDLNRTQPAEPQKEIENLTNRYPDLDLRESLMKTDTSGNKWIEGVVKNNGNVSYQSVQITFRLLDAKGKQLGDAIAISDRVAPGDTWDFQAVVLDNETVSIIPTDITAS